MSALGSCSLEEIERGLYGPKRRSSTSCGAAVCSDLPIEIGAFEVTMGLSATLLCRSTWEDFIGMKRSAQHLELLKK